MTEVKRRVRGATIVNWVRIQVQRRRFARSSRRPPLRIVVGANGRFEPGWIQTEHAFFDVSRADHWAAYFPIDSIDAIFSEHVWEHIPPGAASRALALCFRYLKPGGTFRIAVPDGLHPDPSYIDAVRPGGTGPGSDDHKVLYTVRTLTEALEQAGFVVEPLEYFDESGQFVATEWDPALGKVWRSKRFDPRNAGGALNYTSIVLDGKKR